MLEWDDSFLIGVEVIDSQHKELVKQINLFIEAVDAGRGKQRVYDLLIFLSKHATDHFKDEEKFMKEINYPGLADQMKEHAKFTYKYLDFISAIAKDSSDLIPSVVEYLKEWLVDHLSNKDRKIGTYYARMAGNGSH